MKTLIAALLVLGLPPSFAVAQMRWQPVGQLEMAPGDRVGPLNVSLMGDLVAGSIWNSENTFLGRVWTLNDGIAIATLENVFPSLLPIRFAQLAYDPRTMSARVYAHSRRALRSWTLTGGTPVLDLSFDQGMLVNDVLYDGFRETFIVAGTYGPLTVYSETGERLGAIGTDALRSHGPMTLAENGEELVVASGGFTLTGQMSGVPYWCGDGSCEEAYAQLPASYGPYEALLAVDSRRQRLATLAPIDPARIGEEGSIFHPVTEPAVRLWATLQDWTGDTAPFLTLTGFTQPVHYGEFSVDGARFLTLDAGDALAIWNADTGVREMSAERVLTAHFIPDSEMLFVHRADGTSAIVTIGLGSVVQTLPGPAEEAVISPDGHVLVTYTMGSEGPARVWRRRQNTTR